MTLDELADENPKILEEVEKEETYEDSIEADLSNALSMLEDCFNVFSQVMEFRKRGKGTSSIEFQNWFKKVEDLSLEVLAFVAENKYEISEDEADVCEVGRQIDFKNDI